MIAFDDEFYSENIENVNKIASVIVICTNVLGPLFLLLFKLNVFDIPVNVAVSTFCVTSVVSIIQFLLVYKFNLQKIAMYFSLVGISIAIAYLGTFFHIGIYISYSIIVFLSCLYYNSSLTFFLTIFDYVLMLISVYFKGVHGFQENMIYGLSINKYFLAMGAGFTIEYLFVGLVSNAITRRCTRTLSHVIDKSNQLRNTQLEVMEFIPKVLESHEVFTGHHVKHTVKYVDLIARELARQGYYKDILTEDTINLYSAAANLHDIGKVHIPDNILNNPGKFTPEEFAMMKSHPLEGKKLVESLPKIKNGKFNEIAMQMAFYHHEKYDGTGYPSGLAGKAIPLCARIMTAADVLDACLCARPYKERYEIDKVMEIFEKSKNTHFEPCIADAVIALKSVIFMISQDFRINEEEEEEKEYYWRQKLKKSQESSERFGSIATLLGV